MYLSNLFIENMGSIEKLQILEKDLFLENGNPKPVILLGKNGSGKTTLISSITDSLLELANHAFKDVLPSDGLGHSYYKISGGINTTLRKEYGFSFIQYKNDKKHYQYIDKNGNLSFEDCEKKTNNLVSIHDKRDNEKNYKSSTDTKNDMQFADDLKNNSYCVFPDDRFEFPHWLNRETDKKITNFNLPNLFNGELGKSILIKSSLDTIKPRILDLFLDSRTGLKKSKDGKSYITTQSGQIVEYLQQGVDNINHLLSSILGKNIVIDSNFRGQGNSRIRIIDKKTNQDIIPSLDNLSAGESILLGMFGTIIKYSDLADINKSVKLEDIEGIVVIDEVDLHLHIRLQKEVLPKLIKLFPKVQFIISTHSPFFLYGMNEEFGDNVLMLNMPSGIQIKAADDFEEFNEAYNIFDDLTEDYKVKYNSLEEQLLNINKNIVFVEGTTDIQYIKKAYELYNKPMNFDIDIIGKESEDGSMNSNDLMLKNAGYFLEYNLEKFPQKFIILHDPENSVTEKEIDDKLYIKKMPQNENSPITDEKGKIKGIESLFNYSLIKRAYKNNQEHFKMIKIGTQKETYSISQNHHGKKKIANRICKNAKKKDFKNFEGIFRIIEDILKK